MIKIILSLLILFTSSIVYSKDVTELVNIPYPIRYHKSAGFNAYSDGFNVVIGTELRDYINDENQTGLIILHEVYHNVLNHQKKHEQEVMKFCFNDKNTIPDNNILQSCIKLYEQIHYTQLQEWELEADNLAFLTAKRIGYDSTVCNLFIKLKAIIPNENQYSSHPLLNNRFNNCMNILE